MDRSPFLDERMGRLVPLSGEDLRRGPWQHVAFLPAPLPAYTPDLLATTFNAVAAARAALAALDARASQLTRPEILRQPTLRIEAQSTSALEGTYAPLATVLTAEEGDAALGSALREVLNYVAVANEAFAWFGEQRPLTVGLLEGLQRRLVAGTGADTSQAGRVRNIQVLIGNRRDAPVTAARFIPPPPGADLENLVRDWVTWTSQDHRPDVDPVVAAALSHYQFETVHPFNDGNGRIGRLVVVLQLLQLGVLTEPTLTVSPWFEARRTEYYDRLLAVSTTGDWDGWVRFFADGVAASATATDASLRELVRVQTTLREQVRAAGLRAETAMALVDFAVGRFSFTVPQAERHLALSYPRTNQLVGQLVGAGVLRQLDGASYGRRFGVPQVQEILLSRSG